MNTIIRSLLVWLLLLAVPFQGVASAGVLACLSDHHAPARAPVAMAHAAPAAHASMDGDMPDCHKAAGAVAQTDKAPAHDGHGSHQDKSCASCCIGVAIAPALLPSLALAPPEFVAVPFRAGHVPSVDPSLPERPPRALFA